MNVTSIMPVMVSVASRLGLLSGLLSKHTHSKQGAQANDNAIADALIQSSIHHLVVAEGTSGEESQAESLPVTLRRMSFDWDLRGGKVRRCATPVPQQEDMLVLM